MKFTPLAPLLLRPLPPSPTAPPPSLEEAADAFAQPAVAFGEEELAAAVLAGARKDASACSIGPKAPSPKKQRAKMDDGEGGACSCIVMAEDSSGTPWPARLANQKERREFIEGKVGCASDVHVYGVG